MASSQDELRIVLIGKTGNGKSATGNSLLHSRTAFHSTQSPTSITKECEKKTATCTDIHGQQKKLLVVDTPGFSDTTSSITNQMVEKTITSQIFNMTSPGVHAFLIVLRVDRFTPEEKNTVDFIKTIFGEGAAKYCIVIFTREDQLEEGQTIDAFINKSSALQELVNICGNRKLAINNRLSGQFLEAKTNKLLQMIDEMIEQQRRKDQARREQEERDKKKAYEEALVAKVRAEEQKKAQEREEQIRREERAAVRSRGNNYDDYNPLSDRMSRMMLDYDRPSTTTVIHMPPSQARPSSSGGHGNRLTGEFVVSNGSANSRPIWEGPRGGQKYINANGNWTYLRK